MQHGSSGSSTHLFSKQPSPDWAILPTRPKHVCFMQMLKFCSLNTCFMLDTCCISNFCSHFYQWPLLLVAKIFNNFLCQVLQSTVICKHQLPYYITILKKIYNPPVCDCLVQYYKPFYTFCACRCYYMNFKFLQF